MEKLIVCTPAYRPLLLLSGLFAVAVVVAGCPKPPGAPERPWGPQAVARNSVTACSTRAVDAGGDVSFQFDWGDGSQSEWSALQPASAAFGDTHTYVQSGSFGVRARAKTARSGPSDWSEELILRVEPGEGELVSRFAFRDPEEPEDSADFSLNTFALGLDGRSYVGCEWALIFRASEGRRDKEFFTMDLDGFLPAPSLSADGVLYIAAENEMLYAFSTNGTRRWSVPVGDDVLATTALGSDGTIFLQTVSESLYAFNPNGSRRWSFPSNGISSPVVGVDGTVYACSDEGRVYVLDPATGGEKNSYNVSGNAIHASPALDPGRNRLYVADEEGNFVALSLATFTDDWIVNVGIGASSPVIGADGTVYIGGNGKLHALDPATGDVRWSFAPPLDGVVSTPAVSDQGVIYVIASAGRKMAARATVRRAAFDSVDSLYAVNADGGRRWAFGLDYGEADDIISAPKIDAAGNVYLGSGFFAWIVRGSGGPADSPWPMFQRDGQNTGRARN